MAKKQSTKCCCGSNIRSFIRFISGKKRYSNVKEKESSLHSLLDIGMVIENPKKIVSKEVAISIPKRETEFHQYDFKGEIVFISKDNVRFQEWLRLVESSK